MFEPGDRPEEPFNVNIQKPFCKGLLYKELVIVQCCVVVNPKKKGFSASRGLILVK